MNLIKNNKYKLKDSDNEYLVVALEDNYYMILKCLGQDAPVLINTTWRVSHHDKITPLKISINNFKVII